MHPRLFGLLFPEYAPPGLCHMSDAAGSIDVAGQGGGTPAPTGAIGAADPATGNPLLGGGDTADAGDDAVDAGDNAAEDWRDKIAAKMGIKDDPKEMAWLKRFATEDNFLKNLPKLRRDFSSARTLVQDGPPEGATDAEIVAYRKAAGIPEKPEGYAIEYPAELTPTDGDKAILASILEKAHGRHVPAAQMKAVVGAYMEVAQAARQAQADAVQELTLQGIAEMRGEWKGREFDRNRTIGYEFLEKHLGDKAPDLAKVRLADGRVLGQLPDFNRLIVSAGRATADEETLIGGDIVGSGKSMEDEIAELRTKSVTGRISKAEDARLNQLYEARVARDERQGRGRSASSENGRAA